MGEGQRHVYRSEKIDQRDEMQQAQQRRKQKQTPAAIAPQLLQFRRRSMFGNRVVNEHALVQPGAQQHRNRRAQRPQQPERQRDQPEQQIDGQRIQRIRRPPGEAAAVFALQVGVMLARDDAHQHRHECQRGDQQGGDVDRRQQQHAEQHDRGKPEQPGRQRRLQPCRRRYGRDKGFQACHPGRPEPPQQAAPDCQRSEHRQQHD